MQRALPFFAALLILFISSCKEEKYTGPLTPEQALASFHLDENFNIELFASEPFVNDPVALAFDDQGNAFVVEMYDYPFAPEPGKERGQIRMLIDSNKDGRVDKAIVYADSLSEATSVLPWNGGLIVTAAPGIYYLKDTNNDLRADIKQELFTGFFKGNSEAQITGLCFNVDNWIYATNSGHDGRISATITNDTPGIDIRGADFRFRMDTLLFGPETGSGQFGQAMDEWGHRFVTENSFHIEQSVIPWRYMHRHPHMPPVRVLKTISDHGELMNQLTPPPYWRAERTRRRNDEFRKNKLDRTEYAEDHFTGVAGGVVYAAENFPEAYRGNYFVGEVAGNLVHRDMLLSPGTAPVCSAQRAPGDGEFLASTDPWFRPASVVAGPDGDLYVVDMYRQHIESPFSIPEDLKKEMDFMNGSEQGRIYRIFPKNEKARTSAPDFRNMSLQDVLSFLSHPNYQLRLQAHKMLVARQDKSVVPALIEILRSNKTAYARLHALYVLEALHGLTVPLIREAAKDKNANIREHALRLAGQYKECLPLVQEGINDTSIQVAFQACLTLGDFPASQSLKGLTDCIIKYGHDEWFRTAVLSSVAGSSMDLFETLSKKGWFDGAADESKKEFVKHFSYIVGSRNDNEEIAAYRKKIEGMGKEYSAVASERITAGSKNK